MKRDEFAKFAMALRTYYPRENLLPNNEAMELWYRQLQDIPFKVAEAALNKWVALNKWSPSIAEIREQSAGLKRGSELQNWGDGWQKVLLAVRRYGMYNVEQAMESLDDLSRKCVENIGFINICRSENISVERANFRMLYETYIERQKQDAQLPDSLKTLIAQIPKLLIDEKQQ